MKLAVGNSKSVLWTDDTANTQTPQFIDEDKDSVSYNRGEPPARYNLKPRILAYGDKIITFRNEQGAAKMVPGLNLFDYSQILIYSPSGDEFTREELATFPESYCSDIAMVQGKIAALIVKNRDTYVQFLGL